MAGRGEPNIDENDPLDPDRITPIVPREQPEALVLANVGDSRTSLLRTGRLFRPFERGHPLGDAQLQDFIQPVQGLLRLFLRSAQVLILHFQLDLLNL